jgi:hypothetical protein
MFIGLRVVGSSGRRPKRRNFSSFHPFNRILRRPQPYYSIIYIDFNQRISYNYYKYIDLYR